MAQFQTTLVIRPDLSGFNQAIDRLNRTMRRTQMIRDTNALRREAAALLAEAERIEAEWARRPDLTRFPNGTIITWEKAYVHSHGTYAYAAIKAGQRWYITGKTATNFGNDGLIDFILKDADNDVLKTMRVVTDTCLISDAG